jgi:hypothetical protein
LPLSCATHLPPGPRAFVVQPGCLHLEPPPCSEHFPPARGYLVHPGSLQPPPWATHLPLEWASLVQSCSVHRGPPPCATHFPPV